MKPTFSVVMTVYDNARELEENLPAYLGQNYERGYEVIVVDESSTDDTDDVLTRFKAANEREQSETNFNSTEREQSRAEVKAANEQEQNETNINTTPRFYTTFLPRPNRRVSRQRMALTLGVKAARNEWIVFTSVHVAPSATWLTELAEFATANTALMLGYIRKNGDIRLQLFDDIDKAHTIVGKAERRRSNGHKGKLLRRLRGKYDFTVVRTSLGHNLLRHYELDIHGNKLLGYRLRTMLYNLFH